MFQDRIQERYEQLTPGYRKLADFVMDHTTKVAFMTTAELARQVGVDPATVVRFSQELGYSGYRELSDEIQAYVQSLIFTMSQEDVQTGPDLLELLQDNILHHVRQFFATSGEVLLQVIEVLDEAPRIWVAGEFLGHDIARILARQLHLIDKPTELIHTGMTEVASALSQMQAGEALIAVAPAYFSVDIGYLVKMARQKGLPTICLTGMSTKLPARKADYVLKTPMRSPVNVINYEMPLLVTGLILEMLITHRQEQQVQTLSSFYENMGRLRELWRETETYELPQS